MKILLVNDDGFYSEGIKVLDEVLTKYGHEVWVCAPEKQRSACSHAIHLHKPVQIKKVYDRHYICDGFPADCVLYSVLGAIPIGKPDMVISGINQGFNVSTDLVYSATVGGAEEGALKDIPSIALSCETVFDNPVVGERPEERNFDKFPFADAAQFMAEHIQQFYDAFEPGSFININVPDHAGGVWKTTDVGKIDFHDVVESPDNESFMIRGAAFPDLISDDIKKTDYYTVFVEKVISVSAFKVQLSFNEKMQNNLSSLT